MDSFSIELCERGLVPDALARRGMRQLIGTRLRTPEALDGERRSEAMRVFLQRASKGPIAEHTDDANAQHYEVPPEFFRLVLGPRLKYSGCLFGSGVRDLPGAEDAMLALTAQRARVEDGQKILDLGCGWGSLSLWLAEQLPKAQITAVSNSSQQKNFIDARIRERDIKNVKVITADINEFNPGERFDRILSVEMFEHMRNYQELLHRIRGWLNYDGFLFVHIFCHKVLAYPFLDEGASDWMARHFFTGGVMPSEHMLLNFIDDMLVEDHWWVSGRHYEATSNAWLRNMDKQKGAVRELFAKAYGEDDADRWIQRWRMFFMAVAELFGYDKGNEWGVGHYLLSPR